MSLSEDVQSISLYKPRIVLLHGYVLPFIILYVALLVGWVVTFEGLEHVEALFISVAVIAAANLVTCLFCVWSVHVRCALTLTRVRNLHAIINFFGWNYFITRGNSLFILSRDCHMTCRSP